MNEKEALLDQLRDVELPEVSGVPAPGWWLLMLLLVLMVAVGWYFYRRWRTRLWQRQAREELQNIRAQFDDQSGTDLLSRCSQLARKVVLAADHREQVAHLHGEQWLNKLDEVCGRPEFTQGIGRLLLDQPYRKQSVLASHDINALFDSLQVLINAAGRYKPETINRPARQKQPT